MVFHGEDLGLGVKMIYGGHLHASRGYTEGLVLEGLEFKDGRGGSIGEPGGSGIGEEGTDEGFEGYQKGFLLLAPVSASKSTEKVKAGAEREMMDEI